MNVRKAVIPVAGFGTRFLPVTRAVPKALLPILDTPVIQYAVEEAVAAGIEHVVLVVSPHQESVGAYFVRSTGLEQILERQERPALLQQMIGISSMADITCVHQHEQLGIGHAVLTARPWIGNEPFAVLLPDDVIRGRSSTIGRMIGIYRETGGPVIAAAETPVATIPQKGIVATQAQNGRVYDVAGLVEKPSVEDAPSNLAIVGRYVLPPGIFPILERALPGAGGEIQLTDAIAELLKTHRGTAYRFPGELFDTGVPAGMLKASLRAALERDDISGEIMAYIRRLAATEETVA